MAFSTPTAHCCALVRGEHLPRGEWIHYVKFAAAAAATTDTATTTTATATTTTARMRVHGGASRSPYLNAYDSAPP